MIRGIIGDHIYSFTKRYKPIPKEAKKRSSIMGSTQPSINCKQRGNAWIIVTIQGSALSSLDFRVEALAESELLALMMQ